MSPAKPILLGCVLLAVACTDDDGAVGGMPSLPSLPPVPERYAEPAAGDVRLSLEGIAFRTSAGADVRVASVEAILAGAADRGAPGEVAGGGAGGASRAVNGDPQVHFRSLHIRSPGVRLPAAESRTAISGAGSGAAPGADGFGAAVLERDALDALFTPVPGRGIRVDTLVLTRGEFTRRSADGGWEWRAEDVDLALRDVRFGRWTTGAEGLRLVSASADIRTGERRSIVRGGTGRLVRSDTEAEATVSFVIDGSAVAGSVEARRGVEWSAELETDRLDLASIRPILPELPEDGSARGFLRVRTAADGTEYVFDDFELSTPRSRIFADGGVSVAPPLQRPILSADNLLLRLEPAGSTDMDALLGLPLPGGGTLRGSIRADGSGSSAAGIAVNADLTHEDSGGTISHVAIDGRAGQRPAAWLDLDLVGRPIRVADTAFTVELAAEGSLDSLALRGQATPWAGTEQRRPGELDGVARVLASVPDLTLRLDADLLRRGEESPRLVGEAEIVGPAELVTDTAADGSVVFRAAADRGGDRIWARAEGAVALSGGGEVMVGIVADSLPLALLPSSGPIEQPSGFAHADVEVRGSIDDPRFRGGLSLRDAGFVVSELNMPVDSLTGEVRFRDRRVTVEQITARAGGGDLRMTGTADLGADPPMLDFRLQADSVRALDRSDAWLVGSGDFTLEGPLDRPLLAGEARIDRGAVREGEIGTDTHLDVDDPPHRELASRVPWPSGSRLRAAGPPEPLPLELDVRLTVDTVFDLWDEDSDLAGEGVIRLHTRDGELAASGRYEIVRGFYAFFGERFRVLGGAFRFTGDGIIPWLTLRGEHDQDEPLGHGRATSRTAADRRPLLEFFAIGSATDRRRFLRRSSLLPQTQTQLAQLLLFSVPPVPMEGWRQSLFWRASRAEALFGTRAETQAVSLLWSYTADEAYDYVPIDRGYLRGGTMLVGSRYPGRLVVGPLFRAGVSFSDRFEVLVLQPFRGGSGPGFRGRYRMSEGAGGTGELEVFNEPRYFSLRSAGAEFPGYYYRWRRGLTVRWWWTF